MKKIILFFTLLAVMLTSCLKDEYELDNLSVGISPEIAIPILTTSIEADSNDLLDLFFSDTVEIDSSIFAHISRATIRVNVENEFPLEGKLVLYIADDNYVILDSLTDGLGILIQAATVDSSGETIEITKKRSDLLADEDAILNLRNSVKIIILTELGTGNNGSAVKIHSTYSMKIKLGLMAKVNFELENRQEDEE